MRVCNRLEIDPVLSIQGDFLKKPIVSFLWKGIVAFSFQGTEGNDQVMVR